MGRNARAPTGRGNLRALRVGPVIACVGCERTADASALALTMLHPPDSLNESAEERAQRRVGTFVAERWYIEEVLGVGGMATVYLAIHHRNGRRVALKILHPELSRHEAIRERFFLEAYAGNRVGHPGVVNALDDGFVSDDLPYLVLEYLEGESLDEHFKRGRNIQSSDEVCAVAEGVLDILQAVHARGVIHRDIKPENIFVTSSGQFKLLDFGIAKVLGAKRRQTTELGTAMGTPSFMSPEQARGRWEEVDERSDLYAVAATLYALLSGRYPRQAETTNEALLAAMTRPLPPIAEVAPWVHPRLAAVIDKGLKFEKTGRFRSASEMKAAIRWARLPLGREALSADQTGATDTISKVAAFSQPPPLAASNTPSPVVASLPRSRCPRDARRELRKSALMMSAFVASAALGFGFVRSNTPQAAIGAASSGVAADESLTTVFPWEGDPTPLSPEAGTLDPAVTHPWKRSLLDESAADGPFAADSRAPHDSGSPEERVVQKWADPDSHLPAGDDWMVERPWSDANERTPKDGAGRRR